jgi:transcriptional regulator with XRE-family HTH domain
MTLLRRHLGSVLRSQRERQHRTLRDVSGSARVSLGYLSEIERGHKEASSELLAAVCDALGLRISDVLYAVADDLAVAESVSVPVLEAVPAHRDGNTAAALEPVASIGPVGAAGATRRRSPRVAA